MKHQRLGLVIAFLLVVGEGLACAPPPKKVQVDAAQGPDSGVDVPADTAKRDGTPDRADTLPADTRVDMGMDVRNDIAKDQGVDLTQDMRPDVQSSDMPIDMSNMEVMTDTPPTDTGSGTATFSGDIFPTLNSVCVTCHGNLDTLARAFTWINAIPGAGRMCVGMKRLDIIVKKVDPTVPGTEVCGDKMPQGTSGDAAFAAKLKIWIAAGAQNN